MYICMYICMSICQSSCINYSIRHNKRNVRITFSNNMPSFEKCVGPDQLNDRNGESITKFHQWTAWNSELNAQRLQIPDRLM